MALAAVALVSSLGSGCSLEDLNPFPRSAEEGAGGGLPTPPSPPDALVTSLNGSWEGTYTCNQGLTRLRLDLVHGSGGRITGILRFSADPSNPTVPSGSFSVVGSLTGSSLELRGDDWIVRPGVYEMVSLSAQLSSANPDQIQGTVNGYGCSTFTVRRT
ncbi:hypothetical protein [Actinomadura sp. SCN-SB]|uniref:hypothetical protein n=1 Tax=Actinomadura sp. SCN-SB TaxID=3373092 RepID=UPI003752D21A